MQTGPSQSAYQELILEHARHPRHRGELAPPARRADGVNRLCGDEVSMYLAWDAAGGAATSFTSKGCALCRASASILADAASGKTPEEVAALVARFRQTFAGTGAIPAETPPDVVALYDLRRYPSRETCVLLAWTALADLLR